MESKQPRHTLVPEALGQRPDLLHNRYQSGATPTDLDGVSVQFGTPTKPHTYQAPTGEGITSRRLRRFALVLSRFQLANSKRLAKSWKVKPTSLKYAEQILANTAYKTAFNDDPTTNVLNTKALSLMLSEPTPNEELVAKALSYCNTEAFEQIVRDITIQPVADLLTSCGSSLASDYEQGSWNWRRVSRINSSSAYDRKQAYKVYKELAREIERLSRYASGNFKTREQEETIKKNGDTYADQKGGKPGYSDGSDRWYPLIVSKPELPLVHTGKMGRKLMYTDTGRTIKNISRIYSDPEQRIFTRKTRAIGAVVVIDCSGSMNLSEMEIDEMIQASAGATILCYSTGSSVSQEYPNAWVVARKGRRVRQLPHFPGGNGCDAPALMYGLKELRENSRQPVIWISDGRVTGMRDQQNVDLSGECDRIVERFGVIVCRTNHQAITKLKQLQGKG
jgi:hypothetical protein